MRTKRNFDVSKVEYFRPELSTCPHCTHGLIRASKAWRKTIQTLNGPRSIYCYAYRCRNLDCPQPQTRFTSAAAEALSLKGSTFGLDIIAFVGHQRARAHATLDAVHALLLSRNIQVSQRQTLHLWQEYLALVRASLPQQIERIQPEVTSNGGILLSVDGVQPEKGNDVLWVVREVLTGQVLAAKLLETSKKSSLEALLRPVSELGWNVLGVISDKQESLVQAIAAVFPGVPHQYCQFHFFRDATQPMVERDRKMKTQLKVKVRGVRAIEEALLAVPEGARDSAWKAIQGYAAAFRAALLERGVPPFDLPGLNIYDFLEALDASLERCLSKKGRTTTS